jgi:hypothetical protein
VTRLCSEKKPLEDWKKIPCVGISNPGTEEKIPAHGISNPSTGRPYKKSYNRENFQGASPPSKTLKCVLIRSGKVMSFGGSLLYRVKTFTAAYFS